MVLAGIIDGKGFVTQGEGVFAETLSSHQNIGRHPFESTHVRAYQLASESDGSLQIVRIKIVQRSFMSNDLDTGQFLERYCAVGMVGMIMGENEISDGEFGNMAHGAYQP